MQPHLLLPKGTLRVSPPDLRGVRQLPTAAFDAAKTLYPGLNLTQRGAIEFPDGSIYVDAPDLPQPTTWSCALVAASFARLYGVGPDSVDEFLKGMKSKRSGTDPAPIAKYLTALGLKARVERDMTRDDLLDLLDQEIGTILCIQAWSDDPADYDDPTNCTNGHYVGAIGYFSGPPQTGAVCPSAGKITARHTQLSSVRAKGAREDYLLFMDPSILCRYGYLSWPNLDRRWRCLEGTRRKPRFSRHLGIVVDPNGHKPIHGSVAEEIL